MNETALLYALSTLAQTCAALVAFVGALGLYRLQSLANRRQETERNLRSALFLLEPESRLRTEMSPARQILERARRWRERHSSGSAPGGQEDILRQLEEYLQHWENVGPDSRRTSRLLMLLVVWNLGVILVAMIAFDFISILKGCWFASFGLWVSVVGVIFFTALMLLEMLGSLPDWLKRLHLIRLLTWLEREYRT